MSEWFLTSQKLNQSGSGSNDIFINSNIMKQVRTFIFDKIKYNGINKILSFSSIIVLHTFSVL